MTNWWQPFLVGLAICMGTCGCERPGGLVTSTVESSSNAMGSAFESVAKPFVNKAYNEAMEREILVLVNKERKKNRLPALVVARDIHWLAREHSQDMAYRTKLTHHSINGDLVDERANRASVDWQTIAENVARNKGFDDPVAKAMEGWLKSPGHRANILNTDVRETGIGVVTGSDGYTYFTQVFIQRMPE